MGPAGCLFLLSLLMGTLSSDEEEAKNLLKSICGRPAVTSSIASGREANVGQWPWQVSIRQGLFHLCGATLISDRRALTAASCFWSKDTRKYNVVVGSLQAFDHPKSRSTIIPTSRIIFHPDFQEDTSSAIAVVELAYPVSFSPVVLPICLPSSAVQLKNATSCWVTGWGYSGIYHYTKPPYTLKELKVPLIDLQTCNDYYQKKNLFHGVKPNISEAMICSKFPVEQMDHCIGSRGDPLMCQVEDFWVLAGVMSWDSNCTQTNEPGVYTNISFYKSWIEKSAISFTDFSATPSLDFSRLFPVIILMSPIFLVLP
ncbi:serine protease 48-like [Talpa occidentalis]|uniref:serine protease 48-like n=1 Tax=Talpa occidentalis TaxID=50954 RepID=UPI00188E4044|nr:serine protease 48-like [Talpa occidentalis]